MATIRNWISRNIIVISIVGGASLAVLGLTITVGVLASRLIGGVPGWSLAATVFGVATARGALLWSRLAIIEEAAK